MGADAARPHVVVLGAGFAGLRVARGLRKAPVRVTLVDRRNHHLFQPLLYQVATAGLAAPDVAYPIRKLFRGQRNCTVYLAGASRVDRQAKVVHLDDGEQLSYDTLVLATGLTHNYFGHDAWQARAPGLKSIDEALEIRRRVLTAFEAAEREQDPARRAAWLTFVVVGGGPTGVELAGALAEIARKTLTRDFRNVDPSHARVVLVDVADRVLGGFDPELSEAAYAMLDRVGVRLELGRPVVDIDDQGVSFGDDRIAARTVLWAAGVRGTPIGQTLGAPLDRAGRVEITDRLHLADDPDVFVLGDLAHLEQDGAALPGVAQVAIQQGEHTAGAIRDRLAGRATAPFRYRDKGSLATIGRARAVAHIGRWKLAGRLAWWIWLMVHILFLIGFRNRVVVMFEWAWAYLTYQRSARVILENPIDVTGRKTEG